MTTTFYETDNSPNLLIITIFKMAWPVWKSYQGNVPPDELESLEQRGDWPRGMAIVVIERLNRDKALRDQLQDHF